MFLGRVVSSFKDVAPSNTMQTGFCVLCSNGMIVVFNLKIIKITFLTVVKVNFI